MKNTIKKPFQIKKLPQLAVRFAGMQTLRFLSYLWDRKEELNKGKRLEGVYYDFEAHTTWENRHNQEQNLARLNKWDKFYPAQTKR